MELNEEGKGCEAKEYRKILKERRGRGIVVSYAIGIQRSNIMYLAPSLPFEKLTAFKNS
jgi:hypothetical protein